VVLVFFIGIVGFGIGIVFLYFIGNDIS